jgi:hypothetical protein
MVPCHRERLPEAAFRLGRVGDLLAKLHLPLDPVYLGGSEAFIVALQPFSRLV